MRSRKLSKRCRELLSKKIKINMHEYKTGRRLSNKRTFKNRSQAIATSYNQTRKKHPRCFK